MENNNIESTVDYTKIDFVAIEAHARQLRAEVMADMIKGLKTAIVNVWAKIAVPSNLGSRKAA